MINTSYSSKFIEANGIRLHYVEQGSGELVILLHGFPEFWYGWRNQLPVLSQKYRVVAPDMRGYHLSDKPTGVEAYKIETLAADIASLIRALGEEKAIVVGHDWGAAVAWAVAAHYPQVVKKLAILNVPHPQEMSRAFLHFNLAQWLKSWYIFFFQLPYIPEKVVGTEKFFRKTLSEMSTKNAFTEEDIQRYVQAYSKPGTVKATIAYYRAAFRSVFGRQVPFPKIKAPVLMLWGVHDKALGKELTYRTAQYCENECTILYDESSGHFVQHDNPAWVNARLLSFFAE